MTPRLVLSLNLTDFTPRAVAISWTCGACGTEDLEFNETEYVEALDATSE